jgi:CheY-like chemotaxis protein
MVDANSATSKRASVIELIPNRAEGSDGNKSRPRARFATLRFLTVANPWLADEHKSMYGFPSMHVPQILVVEDFEQFRRFVVSTLRQRARFQVAEASNGLEALQKVEEQEPDVVLLDIGLPNLNGIEVAKCLRRLAVPPKIVFISQESSPEVVREVLDLGALGYVHKLRAGSDLLPAVNAALEGGRFVSKGLESKERCLVAQIGYDQVKVAARTDLLRAHGYQVVSVIGNEAARRVLDSLQHCDVFLVGPTAPKETREEMVAWLKAKFPGVPILALNPSTSPTLRGADHNVNQNSPEVWLPLITRTLGHCSGVASAK